MNSTDSNEWDIKIPTEGDLESKLRAVERQLAGQAKEFIFVLDLEGNNLYRAKGTGSGIPHTKELQDILLSRQVIVITHNHPSEDLTFSLADLDAFFQHRNIQQLRATSGKQTIVLEESNRNKAYLKKKYSLMMLQKNKVLKQIMTQEAYNLWEYTQLPTELSETLALDITLIDL
ncbi:MAG: hypothetical protein EAZ95_07495 [Bacteroidetes bacterium]|nr:MAG: hypothetical protein EAZ95_07495 [Bacteroidota bacterium]